MSIQKFKDRFYRITGRNWLPQASDDAPTRTRELEILCEDLIEALERAESCAN